MKLLASIALIVSLGASAVYAQQRPVKMTVSGTDGNSAIDLGTGTATGEFDLGGNGTFGRFTLRLVSAGAAAPAQSSSCPSPKLYIPVVAGGGVFRFEDGSLLNGVLTQGSDCIDFVANQALCIRVLKVMH